MECTNKAGRLRTNFANQNDKSTETYKINVVKV